MIAKELIDSLSQIPPETEVRIDVETDGVVRGVAWLKDGIFPYAFIVDNVACYSEALESETKRLFIC